MIRIAAGLFLGPMLLLATAASAQEPAPGFDPDDTLRAVEVSAVDVPPAFVDAAEAARTIDAHYPPALRSARVSERILVRLLVDTLGRARVPRLELAARSPELGAAAVRAVEEMRFVPARWAGAAYPVWVDLPVTFASPAAPAPTIGDSTADSLSDGTYELEAVEVPPQLSNAREVARAIALNYPPEMRDAGIRGTVTVRFRIDAEGKPGPARIDESTRPEFVEAAVRGIQVMRFQPARAGGRPVHVWVSVPITFELEAGPPPPAPAAGTAPATP